MEMTYDYRIVKFFDREIIYFKVLEVYYDINKIPRGFDNFLLQNCKDMKELEDSYYLIEEAFNKPFLIWDNESAVFIEEPVEWSHYKDE